jgi:hypothetical protein
LLCPFFLAEGMSVLGNLGSRLTPREEGAQDELGDETEALEA